MDSINFESALSETPAGVIIVNRELKIVFINTSAVILLKLPASQALGQSLSGILFPGNKDRIAMHDSYMRNVFELGLNGSQSMGGRVVPFNGRKLEISLQVIGDFCAAYVLDKTELIEIKAKLEAKPDISQTLVLKTSDIRLKIIHLLVGLMLSLVIASTITSAIGHKEQARVLDSLLSGFVGVFSSCAGFFFREDRDKDK